MSLGAILLLMLLGMFVALAVCEIAYRNPVSVASGRNDDRLVTNFVLTALGLAAGGVFPLVRIVSSLAGAHSGIRFAGTVQLPWVVILAATLLLDSFVSYWVHRLMHATPLLWRIHRVHHADTEVDLSTSLRNHPFELLVTVPASVLVIMVTGATPSVVMVIQAIFIGASFWEHTDIALPGWLERVLSIVFITPRLHRAHHSSRREVHDRNFGDLIILWDRLFGTFEGKAVDGPVGLEGQRTRPDHLLDQICSPLYPAT